MSKLLRKLIKFSHGIDGGMCEREGMNSMDGKRLAGKMGWGRRNQNWPPFRKGAIVLAVAILLATWGCAPHWIKKDVSAHGVQESNSPFHQAMRCFQAGDYAGARAIFAPLRFSGDAIVRRQALYGLACIGLTTADSREAFDAAVALWKRWCSLAAGTYQPEDPRMLAAFLPAAMREGMHQTAGPDPSAPRSAVGGGMFVLCEKERSALAARLAALEKELRVLKARATAARQMEKELTTLREQMRTMEAIDQKIQEKKQEMSSP